MVATRVKEFSYPKRHSPVRGPRSCSLSDAIRVLLVSIVIFISCIVSCRTRQALSGIIKARVLAYVIVPLCFRFAGSSSHRGGVFCSLRRMARKIVMFLSIVPVTTCASLGPLRQKQYFRRPMLTVRRFLRWALGYSYV